MLFCCNRHEAAVEDMHQELAGISSVSVILPSSLRFFHVVGWWAKGEGKSLLKKNQTVSQFCTVCYVGNDVNFILQGN